MAAGDWSPVLAEYVIALQPSGVGGWTSPPLAEFVITLAPSEVGGWTSPPLAEFVITLTPSEAEGWTTPPLAEYVVTLAPEGTQTCSIDADCPEGYVCENGYCVKEGGNIAPVILGVVGVVAGAALVVSLAKKKEAKEKGK